MNPSTARGSKSRPFKRQRISNLVSYHDPIVSDDLDFDIIHSREGRLRRSGTERVPAPSERSSQVITDTAWARRTTWAPEDDTEYALDPDGHFYDVEMQRDVMDEPLDEVLAKKKKVRSRVSKRPHVVWMELHRSLYLDELLRWSGRGDFCFDTECRDCLSRKSSPAGTPEYRCLECLLPDLSCMSCCVRRHKMHPFHRIEHWTGAKFVKVSLNAMGLKVQLNHASLFCVNPIPCHAQMLVLHTNGIHDIAIQYCGCTRAIPPHLQLLRRGLYPASQLNVKTCATFDLLGHLHIMALTTKASTYDFYRALEKMTDPSGIKPPKSRYRALFRMILQWRHLKMLKWGGRANDETGVAGTKDGELAIQCPSCPRVGVNIPSDFEDAPDGMKFLYMMIICMDANFRLKNQLVSNYSQDPGLGTGWAYMLPRAAYERYVLSRASDEDISTCVGFQALAKANKFVAGLRYTGVSGASCGRSEMLLPLGVGNLMKGERYANMDFMFASAVLLNLLPFLLISYDICCQWFINLHKRMEEQWPEELRIPSTTKITPAIPKLHEPMHEAANHQVYSLNYIPGVGLTDAECPERIWGPHNILGNSTKGQGPGSRCDVLDDHFNFWNWQKYTGMGITLARRYKAAVAERNIQTEGHRGLTMSLDPNLVEKWENMCVAWELDVFPKKAKNPYQTEGVAITEAQVRKTLADEEETRLVDGGVALHTTSSSAFLVQGLDLEDTQRRLRRLAKHTLENATTRREGTLTEQRNVLRTRIRAWELLQPIYMPGLLQHRTNVAASNAGDSQNPEDGLLYLPSALSILLRTRVCVVGLAEMEEQLRSAQCTDALETVRHTLKLKSRMVLFKHKNVRGQRQGTRSRTVIDRVHERARVAADKYRAARKAKYSLTGPGEWEKILRVLEDSDVRSYQDPNRLQPRRERQGIYEDEQLAAMAQGHLSTPAEPNGEESAEFSLLADVRSRRDGTGETRRTLSWIWLSQSDHSSSEDDADEILRAEWAKSRARANRTREEVMMLKEEMRRTLAYLEWRAGFWRDRSSCRLDIDTELTEGLSAFANGQAGLQDALADRFRLLWKAPLQDDTCPLAETNTADSDSTTNAAATSASTSTNSTSSLNTTLSSDDARRLAGPNLTTTNSNSTTTATSTTSTSGSETPMPTASTVGDVITNNAPTNANVPDADDEDDDEDEDEGAVYDEDDEDDDCLLS